MFAVIYIYILYIYIYIYIYVCVYLIVLFWQEFVKKDRRLIFCLLKSQRFTLSVPFNVIEIV